MRSAERAVCRLHAMCTLDGLNALTPSLLQTALKDPHPGVRRHAVRLAERHLSAKFSDQHAEQHAQQLADQAELGRSIAALARDQDPQIRLQVAYTLGYWRDHARAGAALGTLMARENDDPYLTAAVLSSVNKGNLSSLVATLHSEPDRGPPPPLWESLFRTALGFKQDKATIKLVELLATKGPDASGWQFDCLARLIGVLDSRRMTLAGWATASGPGMEAAVKRLKPVFETARSDAASAGTPLPRWTLAVGLLARDGIPNRKDLDLLSELAAPQSDVQKQEAAINALARLSGKQVPRRLLSGWKGYSPARRSQVLEALSSREPWLAILLEAIERGDVLPTEIDAVARERLLASPNPTLRAAGQKLLADQVDPDREGVVEAYRAALEIDGNVEAWRELFARTCAVCHQIGALGRQVGPDLAMVRQKPADWFLPALLDPSRAVDARYVNYVAITTDGRTLTGVLAGETGNSLTMVGPDGKHQSLLRSDLDALSSTGKSAMPTGLEKDLKPPDIANLIAFLREAPLPKVVEGNFPALVQPDGLGRLELKATNCEIYGDEIRIYDKHACLGWWTGSGDRAAWYVELPAAGRYWATIEYSCDDSSSGQGWVLESSDERLEGTVKSTGDWETYKQAPAGELRLQAGLNRLVFRSAGEIKESTYLIDLKGILLEPTSGAGRSGS